MQKILKWLTPLIAVGVAVFIIFFLISINSNEETINLAPLEQKSEVVKKEEKKVWLNNFSKTQRLGYFYPVNEVLIEVELNEKVKVKTIYKLSAPLLDPYQLFCLKEELSQHKLKYYLKRDKKGVELLIYSSDKKKLDSLVRVLKNYQISAKISLHKEDV
jgi:biopolymer transport protein ExbD